MQVLKKQPFLILIAAVGIFGWGLMTWFNAQRYQPSLETTSQIKQNSDKSITTQPSNRPPQTFLEGKMFFGKQAPIVFESPKPVLPVIQFVSKLVVWGIISGSENRAVVGLDPKENTTTWVLKAGDQLGGEKIVKINSDFIVVKNETGVGKVNMIE